MYPLQPEVLNSHWHIVDHRNHVNNNLSHQTCSTTTQFIIAEGRLPLKYKSEDEHQNCTKKKKNRNCDTIQMRRQNQVQRTEMIINM